MDDPIAQKIYADLERLCTPGDRDLGTLRNRAATDYVLERLREAGTETDELTFEVPEWRYGDARVSAGALRIAAHPGPYSPAVDGEAPLIVIASADEIEARALPGAVLLLRDTIAATQFTPRDYPFYQDAGHAAVLDALESARPLAIIAATKDSPMTGAMSPFPLIEEVGFAIPHAYLRAEEGALLAEEAGRPVHIEIESEVVPSTGSQPTGRLPGSSPRRVLVTAHVDSKPETPGALDNAAGVAVLLAVADLLRGELLDLTIEFVPFNGEDHVLAPGEMAWLAANDDLSDIELVVNIDATGLPGGPSAYSLYGLDDDTSAVVGEIAARHPNVTEGPQWPASDHMIFAMRGIPAIALTSHDFTTASRVYSHTPADALEIVDTDLLADAAHFIADLVRELGARSI